MFGGVIVIFEKVSKLISEQLDISESRIDMDSDVIDDFEADSMDIVDLIMSLEEEFGIEVPDDDIENLRKVSDIVKYIEEKM